VLATAVEIAVGPFKGSFFAPFVSLYEDLRYFRCFVERHSLGVPWLVSSCEEVMRVFSILWKADFWVYVGFLGDKWR